MAGGGPGFQVAGNETFATVRAIHRAGYFVDQAPSAQLKFDVDVHGREQRVTQWFEFSVSFENDTDEVNFKMFQSEAFEAGAEQVIPPLKPLPGTVMIGTKPTFYSIFDEVQVPRKPMSFKVGK